MTMSAIHVTKEQVRRFRKFSDVLFDLDGTISTDEQSTGPRLCQTEWQISLNWQQLRLRLLLGVFDDNLMKDAKGEREPPTALSSSSSCNTINLFLLISGLAFIGQNDVCKVVMSRWNAVASSTDNRNLENEWHVIYLCGEKFDRWFYSMLGLL